MAKVVPKIPTLAQPARMGHPPKSLLRSFRGPGGLLAVRITPRHPREAQCRCADGETRRADYQPPPPPPPPPPPDPPPPPPLDPGTDEEDEIAPENEPLSELAKPVAPNALQPVPEYQEG